MDDLEISTDRARLDVARVHHWLSTDTSWALGRTLDQVEQAADHSVNVSAFVGGVQVGHARLVTDRTTFAWLCDVYVEPLHRGRGVAQAMVRAVGELLTTYGVKRAVLSTSDAHGLYERHGFARIEGSGSWMSRGYTAGASPPGSTER